MRNEPMDIVICRSERDCLSDILTNLYAHRLAGPSDVCDVNSIQYGDTTGVCQTTGSATLSLATVGAPGACGDRINTDRSLYHRRYGIDMSPSVVARNNMQGHQVASNAMALMYYREGVCKHINENGFTSFATAPKCLPKQSMGCRHRVGLPRNLHVLACCTSSDRSSSLFARHSTRTRRILSCQNPACHNRSFPHQGL